MALKLILVRHAKSSWDDLTLPDHDRPLNKRGRASARALGDWLRHEGMLPDQIFTSSAQRTLETLDLMQLAVKPVVKSALYHAGAFAMLHQIKDATGRKVMVLGHNPGIGELAERLARKLPKHQKFLDYPTGATTVFRFNTDSWKDVEFGTGKVKSFVIPRELI
ncbi:SixA phosphatase family protein [Shimia abyssi]|uniref:Phosphohistidine phosphatase n=1 Tax=Shimia abyssi TaxID=1662395 RepID=A0A2P8F9V7_9RHOB|nr:histidine phosphatase family protein [Shimia abyssi]PSL18488.1 phosphohistidine phosphatase [Shimia abyssi]